MINHIQYILIDIVFTDKTIKLWKVSERDKMAEGYNLRDESGQIRDPSSLSMLRVILYYFFENL